MSEGSRQGPEVPSKTDVKFPTCFPPDMFARSLIILPYVPVAGLGGKIIGCARRRGGQT